MRAMQRTEPSKGSPASEPRPCPKCGYKSCLDLSAPSLQQPVKAMQRTEPSKGSPASGERSELLPCPFCGSENVSVEPLVGGFVVDCKDCGGGCGTCHSEDAACEEWNKRKSLTSILKERGIGPDKVESEIRSRIQRSEPRGQQQEPRGTSASEGGQAEGATRAVGDDGIARQIARESELELRGLANEKFATTASWHKAREAIILSAIERATEPLQKQLANVARINTQTNANLAEVKRAHKAVSEMVDGAIRRRLEAEQQLAAERQRSEQAEARPAPIVGNWIAHQSENPKYPEEWDVFEGGPRGYSVIGDGFITESQAKEIALRHNLTIPPRGQQQEWTEDRVEQILENHGAKGVAKVHNAELAAEVENCSRLSDQLEDKDRQLAAERQRREQEIRELNAEHELAEGLSRNRLQSALAAIEKAVSVFMAEGLTEAGSNALRELRTVDRSALHEHDEEVRADAWTKWHKFFVPEQVRKPLVEALEQAHLRSLLDAERHRSDIKLATTISKEEHELFALNRELEVNNRQLHQRLMSALAAIEKLPERYAEHLSAAATAGELGDVDEKYQVDLLRSVISDIDLSALHEHDAKVREPLVEALEWAWAIIANAGGGDWQRESKGWQDAAAKWRDEAFHPALKGDK